MNQNINIEAIVKSVEKSQSGYEKAIKKLAERFGVVLATLILVLPQRKLVSMEILFIG